MPEQVFVFQTRKSEFIRDVFLCEPYSLPYRQRVLVTQSALSQQAGLMESYAFTKGVVRRSALQSTCG